MSIAQLKHRCAVAEQCLAYSGHRTGLALLHVDMFAEIARLAAELQTCRDLRVIDDKDRQHLTAECIALKADAERYRWLRARDLPWSFKTFPESAVLTRWSSGHAPNEIDKAIDAAIAKEQK